MRCLITLLSAALFGSATLHAITIEEIAANHVAARGGEAALRALHSLRVTGTMEMQGMQTEFRQYIKDNFKYRMEFQMMGSAMIQACDGTTSWSINPMMESEVVEGTPEQTAGYRSMADLQGVFIDTEKKGLTLELVGTADIDGMTAYKVKVTRPEGISYTLYIDAVTWLMVKLETADASRPGMGSTVMMFDNFKSVAGVMMATVVNMNIGGRMKVTNTWTTYEANVPVDDALFAVPSGANRN